MTNHQEPSSPLQQTTGRLLVLAAAVLWSTSGFFAKSPLFDPWPAEIRGPLLAFWRALFASVLLIPLVRRPRWNPKLVPMVLVFAAMNWTYLTAMALTTSANAIWLQNTAPVWVFLIGVWWFGEAVQKGDRWMLACILLGVGLIVAMEMQQAQAQSFTGVLYGLASGLFYAGVVLSLRQLRAEDSAWLVALNQVVTVVLFFPVVLYHDVWPSGIQWLYLAAFGMLQMGLSYLLFARGVRYITGHEAAGIALLEPLLVPIWVYLAWRTAASYMPVAWWTILGGSFILGGLAYRYLGVERGAAFMRRGRVEVEE